MRVTLSKQNSNVPIIQKISDLRDLRYGIASKSLIMGLGRGDNLDLGKYTVVFENFTGSPAYENVHSHLVVETGSAKYAYFAQAIIRKIIR